MTSIIEEHRIDYEIMLKGETAEYDIIFKNKECTPSLKSKTNQEDTTIPYWYHYTIDILVGKIIKGMISQSVVNSGGGGTKGDGGVRNDSRSQKLP